MDYRIIKFLINLNIIYLLFLALPLNAQTTVLKTDTTNLGDTETSITVDGQLYSYSAPDAVVTGYVVDPNAPSFNYCSYNRPKPSFEVNCRPLNTPILHILSVWPSDTITLDKAEAPVLQLYTDYHEGTFAWYDQKQEVELAVYIYDHQGHIRYSKKSSHPNSRLQLPPFFTAGTCMVKRIKHNRSSERVTIWVME